MSALVDWRDAAYAVADLRLVNAKTVGEPVLDDIRRLAQRLDALTPLAPRPEPMPVEVRGFTALAHERVGRFIMATDAVVTVRHPGMEAEVSDCLGVARRARKKLESFALLAAPVIETNGLGLFFPMVPVSGAGEQRITPRIIRALEAAKEAGVDPTVIDAFRAGRPLTVRMVEVVTLARVEDIPLE